MTTQLQIQEQDHLAEDAREEREEDDTPESYCEICKENQSNLHDYCADCANEIIDAVRENSIGNELIKNCIEVMILDKNIG